MADDKMVLTPAEIKQMESALTDQDLFLACPKCGAAITEKWSGVECSSTKCDWWFCL